VGGKLVNSISLGQFSNFGENGGQVSKLPINNR
jgi:hypothetical protein